MSAKHVVLLLGRRDEPTDGVVDYCENLRAAGLARGISFELVRVPWAEKGWRQALGELREAAAGWRNRWVLLQFTTLAWSRRGFPLNAPRVLNVIRQCGARPGVVFHDFAPLPGSGIVGRTREYCHLRVLQQLYGRSDSAIFTIPVDKIRWRRSSSNKEVFIPVGSNFPEVTREIKKNGALQPSIFTVAVFGITGDARGDEEVGDIAYALRRVQAQGAGLRLMAIGRGSAVFEGALRNALNGSGIELSVLGLMPADELARALVGADVLLFVRGHVSSRRGSAIAGIVCGLPVVGYRGEETGFPITEAGVRLVDLRDREGLAQNLAEVLADQELSQVLRKRSMAARQYFSWDSIAAQFAAALADERP